MNRFQSRPVNRLTIINAERMAQLSESAATSQRRRKNLNVHPVLEDPIQRLFNAMEPGTYVRPHRHAREHGWELMMAARGAFAILTFDDDGTVIERVDLSATPDQAAAAEIPPFTWHAVVVTAPGTVMFEVKPGPYCALTDKDFACWAPREGEPDAERFVGWYETARPGDRRPAR